MTNEPMNGCFYLVSGGPAQYRDGKWYSGVEAPFYQCELQWTPTWWCLFPDTDPTAQAEKIAELTKEQEWKPINTAPKDGRMFLVLLPRMQNLFVRGRYNTVHKCFVTDVDSAGAVTSYTVFHDGDLWMDIPKPPAALKEADNGK